MNIEELKEGVIISSSLWPEEVKIDKAELKGNFIRLIGSLTKSKSHIDQLLSTEQLENIKILSENSLFQAEPWKVFLSVEALRYRYASIYDPLLAVNISKVDPLPHQIEAVYGYILKQPQIRFLIADDPGAGKTIMAGLIIKELKLRHIINRILIVCPGHLKDQWRRELKERFDENFEVINRTRFDAAYRINVWDKENQIIISLDFAKKNDILESLKYTTFDLIIVDEAHKMSANKYGEKIDKSERYKLGENLSNITNHLIFLTATPHKGDNENFRLFLDLLNPGYFATTELIKKSIENKDNPLFIRRIKEELKDFEGKPLFLPRFVSTVKFKLSDSEKELYNELSKYVEKEYNKALVADKKRNVAFALTILQRRLASSTYALLKSLERRKQKLEDILNGLNNNINDAKNLIYNNIDIDEIDDLPDEEREKNEINWEAITFSANNDELNNEISIIEMLINKAKYIIEKELETKILKFKESLEKLKENVKEAEKRKILVFSESKDTLDYLTRKVQNWGYKVNTIHGGMKLEDRVNAESIFRNETNVLIATEAAGEGINLQFCNLMINFDIPWNPNRLEQRMGRIHRYGQTREVFSHNLVAEDTREGKVFSKLFEKIEEIKRALGSDKVFDVLGNIIDSSKFTQALLDAAVNAKDINEILSNIDFKVDDDYINNIKENLGETLATHFIDYTLIKEMAQKARENRLIPEYTQNFFISAFEKSGNKIELKKDNTYKIENINNSIRSIANNETFKKKFGHILKSYPSITFDKDVLRKKSTVEFVSFGHPLFEAVLAWVETFSNKVLRQGAVFLDPDGKLDGYILFYQGEITDGTGAIAGKRIFSFFANQAEIKQIPPSILWDFVKSDNKHDININISSLETFKAQAEKYVIDCLQSYQQELLTERHRQAEIKQKYGISSLNYIILKLDNDLIDLHTRKDKGEDVDIVIRNKQERIKEYVKSKQDLIMRIEKEKSLTIGMPEYIGAVRIIPNIKHKFSNMVSDDEIELIGMKIALEFEKNNNRYPEDVSNQMEGYDIRSTDENGNIRYIEVKARAGEGDIALTQNEWFKAQRFGSDYFLYVIYNASKEPELHIINNPAENLKPEQIIETVRYFINKEEILNKNK